MRKSPLRRNSVNLLGGARGTVCSRHLGSCGSSLSDRRLWLAGVIMTRVTTYFYNASKYYHSIGDGGGDIRRRWLWEGGGYLIVADENRTISVLGGFSLVRRVLS